MVSLICWPLTPPLALISATYISIVRFSGSPRNEAGPVTDNTAPIFTSVFFIASSLYGDLRKTISRCRFDRTTPSDALAWLLVLVLFLAPFLAAARLFPELAQDQGAAKPFAHR